MENLRQLAVIDIGSNSVRLVIYDLFGSHFTPVYNEKIKPLDVYPSKAKPYVVQRLPGFQKS